VSANPKQFRQPGCRCFSAGPRALLHRPCGGSYGGSREARAACVNQQLARLTVELRKPALVRWVQRIERRGGLARSAREVRAAAPQCRRVAL
jgi:hypothetical protein